MIGLSMKLESNIHPSHPYPFGPNKIKEASEDRTSTKETQEQEEKSPSFGQPMPVMKIVS
jgi:hypothetical protein